MCGNRLKLWNTMPTSARNALTSTPRPETRSPSMWISPPSIGSSALMQRSSVDLPQPDGPMRHTTWCSSTREVDAAQHLVVAEALVHVAQLDERAHLRLRAFFVDADEVVDEARARES